MSTRPVPYSLYILYTQLIINSRLGKLRWRFRLHLYGKKNPIRSANPINLVESLRKANLTGFRTLLYA
jgi:hypothetical protein